MNRFLIISVIFVLLILGLIFFKNIDYIAFLKIGDYAFESSIFTLIAFLILSVIFLILFLKTIFFFFDLPFLIKKKWRIRKEQKINESILQAAIYLSINDKNKANQLIRKINPEDAANENFKNLLKIIKAKSSDDIEQKTAFYKSLQNLPEFEFYILKSLAKVYFKIKSYAQAEEYSEKANRLKPDDYKILKILIFSYANLAKWENFDATVKELAKLHPELLSKYSEDIIGFYIKAAREGIDQNQEEQSLKFLKAALMIDPVNIEVLELYVTLNLNGAKTDHVLNLIKEAFSIKPSFAIAQIYAKLTDQNPRQIYDELESLTDSKDHVSVFLALSSYLNLPNKTGCSFN